MKFKMSKSRLANALRSVQNVVPSKGSLPILMNVKIEVKKEDDGTGRISFMATDLDTTLMCDDTCEVIEDGVTTLPVKLLAPAVSKLNDGTVEITVDSNNRAKIVSGNASFKVVGISADEFPRITNEESTLNCTFKQSELASVLKMVVFAASVDDTRRTLKGTLMTFGGGKLAVVATDGRRLATYETEMKFDGADAEIIIPSKTVSELLRGLSGDEDCKLSVHGKNMVEFDLGNVRLMSKLIDEAYPNYKQVIPPSRKYRIEVDRKMLFDALDRASVMTMDEAHSTKLVFDEGMLTVQSAASDIGEAKDALPIKYEGEKIEIMFNPSYIMDILKPMVDDSVFVELEDGHSPAVFRTSEKSLCVLMPLRVQ